ncbi:MAG: hypothetical protein M3Y77_20325, partial [Actinomycetota bacterium]|nr:hypothetical protein [Actinomycetota bacterium]
MPQTPATPGMRSTTAGCLALDGDPAARVPHLTTLQTSFDGMITELGRDIDDVAGVGIPSAVELQNYSRGLGLSGADWDRE